ncbi:MAG: hypothetical protein IAE79_17650 [Anaerolinea sp.]|nr:hypothetical protein [Anaerolinea sp.]
MASRTQQIQDRAMELVEIRPMSDEVNTLINQAIAEHGFPGRHEAYQFLRTTGKLDGLDGGGEIVNQGEALAALVREFGCHKDTARYHVAKAAQRKRHPDWTPPQWGGRRHGTGAPLRHAIDVVNGRCIVSQWVPGQVGAMRYSAAVNWEELDEAAAAAVIAQGGSINGSGQYPCPADLVALAVWDTEEDDD